MRFLPEHTTNTLRVLAGLSALLTPAAHAYPLDGYDETGIRRVEAARLAVMGEMKGRNQPPGARLRTGDVDLRLLDQPYLDLPPPDPEFSARIAALLGADKDRYGIALLDLSDPNRVRYAEYRGDYRQNVGSVGKIVAALGLFQALADTYPEDLEARTRVLRDTTVTANEFIQSDHHTVRLWNPGTGALTKRPLRQGDQGSLWEYLDWMLSASSNAAASMVMQQAMLIRQYGTRYPVPEAEIQRFFKETPASELTALFKETFWTPVSRNGLDLDQLRQGSFFTWYGKQRVAGGGTSYGTARELTRFLLRIEQGRIVDEYSSRQIKRLLYMTERRIRYASSPALADSAVYFKSGSLYKCKEEPGFVCKKYHGNVRNYMNSVALIEAPAGQNRLTYIASLISNVLYKNSAVAHQTLGTRIHRLLEADHPNPPLAEGALPPEVTFGARLIGFEEDYAERLTVARIQRALLDLGYDAGEVDGKYGSQTRAAISQFQKSAGLPADGKPSQGLLIRLRQAQGGELPPGAGEQSDRAADR